MTTIDREATLQAAVRDARAEGRWTLLEHEAYGFLPLLGIAAPRHLFVPSGSDPAKAAAGVCAALPGDRSVLKIVASDVLHKTERGGIAFVAKTPASVEAAMRDLDARFADADVRGILAVEQVAFDPSPGGELLLGIRWTADFGPVVTFGFGGVLTEVLDRELRQGRGAAIFSPRSTTEEEIDRVLEGKLVTAIVTGRARGQKERMSRAALRTLIANAMEFASAQVPDPISEIEINPFVALEGRPLALDVLVKLTTALPAAPAAARPLEKLERLLRPRSIAVAGVSRAMNPGRVIVTNLATAGFDRAAMTIIKPGEESIDGVRCVPDIASLPGPVDLLVLGISSDQIPAAIDDAIARRAAESIIVIPGGIGEREGSESLESRVRASIAASRATPWRGPLVNGGNCLGVTSRPGNVDTIFLPAWKLRGAQPRAEAPLAIVSQSGAFAAARIAALGSLSPRYVISIGNQIDLTSGDYLEYLAGDPGISVFAVYVEGFRPLDGRRWLEAARRIARSGRPVILYRAGRTPEGSRASASHTAAIAGDAAVVRELATAAGVLVADTLEEFDDLVRLFALLSDRGVTGRRLAAISNAGFETVAFADNLSSFELAQLDGTTRASIEELVRREKLERVVSAGNPLDVNPMMGDAAFAETC
ncbi:MAG TPA: acetate--CoA ligase family protein, partial [Thermoanaerobaculia bacterium]|nr:acetate--CoA ligase family protein [Thermoanaerobaculia bacterium]